MSHFVDRISLLDLYLICLIKTSKVQSLNFGGLTCSVKVDQFVFQTHIH